MTAASTSAYYQAYVVDPIALTSHTIGSAVTSPINVRHSLNVASIVLNERC